MTESKNHHDHSSRRAAFLFPPMSVAVSPHSNGPPPLAAAMPRCEQLCTYGGTGWASIRECARAIAALGPPSEKNRSAIAGYLGRRLEFQVRKETPMGRVEEYAERRTIIMAGFQHPIDARPADAERLGVGGGAQPPALSSRAP
jgi:hypothetical protein